MGPVSTPAPWSSPPPVSTTSSPPPPAAGSKAPTTPPPPIPIAKCRCETGRGTVSHRHFEVFGGAAGPELVDAGDQGNASTAAGADPIPVLPDFIHAADL